MQERFLDNIGELQRTPHNSLFDNRKNFITYEMLLQQKSNEHN